VCRLLLGARQHDLLVDPEWDVGGADLVWRLGLYYLHITQSRPAPPETDPDGGILGLDLGIVNLATDSDGQTFSGAAVKKARTRYHLRRQRLQQVNTKNAKRRLPKNAGSERRFQKDVNHCISKALALEDLSGLRERVTVRHEQRYVRHSWAFYQLRQFL